MTASATISDPSGFEDGVLPHPTPFCSKVDGFAPHAQHVNLRVWPARDSICFCLDLKLAQILESAGCIQS